MKAIRKHDYLLQATYIITCFKFPIAGPCGIYLVSLDCNKVLWRQDLSSNRIGSIILYAYIAL